MKLEDQVCSLGLAKRLKELGVRQEGLFWWASDERTGAAFRLTATPNMKWSEAHRLVAFTVAELGWMLPQDCYSYKLYSSGWAGQYRRNGRKRVHFAAYTEADARAKLLIYLLENKLV